MKRIFIKCPSCDEKFKGHKITALTTRIYTAEYKKQIDDLYENLTQKRWSEIVKDEEFDPFEDALGVYVLKCPNANFYWLVLFLPYSLDDVVQLSEWNKIENNEVNELLKLIPNERWSAIP